MTKFDYTNEVWRCIEAYSTEYLSYYVSDMGRVKSVDNTGKGTILKPQTQTSGYHQVFLCTNGVTTPHLVHRLVAEAFIANPDNKPVAHHINENKKCNIATNLEWVTYQENNTRGTKIERMKKTKGLHIVAHPVDENGKPYFYPMLHFGNINEAMAYFKVSNTKMKAVLENNATLIDTSKPMKDIYHPNFMPWKTLTDANGDVWLPETVAHEYDEEGYLVYTNPRIKKIERANNKPRKMNTPLTVGINEKVRATLPDKELLRKHKEGMAKVEEALARGEFPIVTFKYGSTHD